MPNWVMNKVKFKSRGKEILDKVITFPNGNKEEFFEDDVVFDFNKIIPLPKSLNITSGGYDRSSMQYVLLKMDVVQLKETIEKLKAIPCSLYGNYFTKIYALKKYDLEELEKLAKDFEKNIDKVDLFGEVNYKELGINTFEDLGMAYINNLINYGADSWYDWCINNWGTKWNSARTYRISDNEVEFETAWNCPIEIFKELSKQFNDVEIVVEFADEDIGSNCGEITFVNGDIQEYIDMDGNTDFALDIWGYDKEDYYNETNEE